MSIRENLEIYEKQYLSEYATLSMNSKGRQVREVECDIRTVFQRDRDRILHSKSFRRLKDKTQVFLTPWGDHYRTRLTHTLEVSQNARTIGKALRLNEDLVEAIAYGHDLGHTPFGHAGERALNDICNAKIGVPFHHNEQSLRTVDILERDGVGLNLTFEVRDGILNHQTSLMPCTLEGKIVRLSDKIAYMYHDMDDAIRGGILKEDDIPESICKVLGYRPKDRLDFMIHDIITNSSNQSDIRMSSECEKSMYELRNFMFEKVYRNKIAKAEEEKAEKLIVALFDYYMENIHLLPEIYVKRMEKYEEPKERAVCDYVGAMSDRFAISLYEDIMVPKSWHV